MLMPSDAAAVAKDVGDFGFVADGRCCNLVHRVEKMPDRFHRRSTSACSGEIEKRPDARS